MNNKSLESKISESSQPAEIRDALGNVFKYADRIESKRDDVRENFKNGNKLYTDVLNFWLNSTLIKTPMIHYKESFEQYWKELIDKASKTGNENQEYYKVVSVRHVEEMMKLSDPEEVKKYNRLVDEFNVALANGEEDLKSFYKKASILIYGEDVMDETGKEPVKPISQKELKKMIKG